MLNEPMTIEVKVKLTRLLTKVRRLNREIPQGNTVFVAVTGTVIVMYVHVGPRFCRRSELASAETMSIEKTKPEKNLVRKSILL